MAHVNRIMTESSNLRAAAAYLKQYIYRLRYTTLHVHPYAYASRMTAAAAAPAPATLTCNYTR
jgi:hypothetical protein